jgi:rRNA-processing protein FCF1
VNNQGQIAAGVRAAVAALALVFAAALFLPAADSLTQVLAGAFGTLSALVGRFALAGLLVLIGSHFLGRAPEGGAGYGGATGSRAGASSGSSSLQTSPSPAASSGRWPVVHDSADRLADAPHEIVLDTSALIDGRFAPLCKSGLLDAPILVPSFVVDELQRLADSRDKRKREQGRRGLDHLGELKGIDRIRTEVAFPWDSEGDVDAALLSLCKERGARLVTTDGPLAQRGRLEDVATVSLAKIARALHTRARAGDAVSVEIVRPGEGTGQGIAYLDDGTMVVVESGFAHIGDEISVRVNSTKRTRGGRVFFATPLEEGVPASDQEE